jgi:hypothetical protein
MSQQAKPTLGALRDELAQRLGFGAQLGNLGAQDALLRLFLTDAQAQLWWMFSWPDTIGVAERTLEADQERYDYPDDCDVAGIVAVVCVRDDRAGQWGSKNRLMEAQGRQAVRVTGGHDGYACSGWPLYYARRDQLYIWPVPSQSGGRLLIEYKAQPKPFQNDSDRCVLPDRAVFLQALVAAKLHYRQPDASYAQQQLDLLWGRMRASEHGERRYMARAAGPDTHRKAVFGNEAMHDGHAHTQTDSHGWQHR